MEVKIINMGITMLIPTYWARKRKEGWKEKDEIYDHPTPLDSEGTLRRCIESIRILRDKSFKLVIIACPVSEDISIEVEKKVKRLVKSVSLPVETFIFTPSLLKEIHNFLIEEGKKEFVSLLSIYGYSNIRNLCIFITHVFNSDIALLIDDDEVFEDHEFIKKVKEFIGKNLGKKKIWGIAGYYVGADGDYHVKKEIRPWMKYWNQYEKMNEAFDKIIGKGPRLKETPFVFGGNMIIHRSLLRKIPFDPNIPRGEDIDYLINAKMFGIDFFLDNELKIKHLPPPKAHPLWRQLRQDIYRFIYEREKIRKQRKISGMRKVYPEDFDPYPGCFLKDDLEEKIEKSSRILSSEYLEKGDKKGSEEAIKNIELAKKYLNFKFDVFEKLLNLQKMWEKLMKYIDEENVRYVLKKIIKKGRI